MATNTGSDATAERFDLLVSTALVEALPDLVIHFGIYGLAQHFVEGYQADAPEVRSQHRFAPGSEADAADSHICEASLSIWLEV